MLCGHKYTSIPTISHKRRSGRHPEEYSTERYFLKGICPRDHLNVSIHNTVADVTKINNPRSTRLLSTLMLAWEAHERKDEPEMADVLKNLVVPQKIAHKRPRRHKHDSIEPSSRKSQQRGGNKSNIPLNSVRDCRCLPCTCYTRNTSLNAMLF